MKKIFKFILIFLIILIVLIIGVVVTAFGEGGRGIGSYFYKKCLPGLVAVPEMFVGEKGECVSVNCLCFRCVKCGNGTCGKNENACNCPQDCKSQQTDITAGWKTHKNEEYGFEFKYPTPADNKRIYPQNEIQFSLPIAEQGTNIDAKVLHMVIKAKDNDQACIGPNWYIKPSENIIINNTNFLKQTGGEGAAGHGYQYIDYTTEKNNMCIAISFVISSYNDLHIPEYTGGEAFIPYDLTKESAIFNQIISTFKFTK